MGMSRPAAGCFVPTSAAGCFVPTSNDGDWAFRRSAILEFGPPVVGVSICVDDAYLDCHWVISIPYAIRENVVRPCLVPVARREKMRDPPLGHPTPSCPASQGTGIRDARRDLLHIKGSWLHHVDAHNRIRSSRNVGKAHHQADRSTGIGQESVSRLDHRRLCRSSELRSFFVDLDSQPNTLADYLPRERDDSDNKAENADNIRKIHASTIAGGANCIDARVVTQRLPGRMHPARLSSSATVQRRGCARHWGWRLAARPGRVQGTGRVSSRIPRRLCSVAR